jgi:phenylacetate-coenzyme A ligase PaaK-like adenylate-forming protein
MAANEVTVESLIANDQYQLSQQEKENLLLPLLRKQVKHSEQQSDHMRKFYTAYKSTSEALGHIRDVAPLPVTMFKSFKLQTCSDEEVVRTLNSSATTTGVPSVIPIDKTTAMRQTKALVSILKSYLGTSRRPFLVVDTASINDPKAGTITARGAAVRGISSFARRTTYIMDETDGELHVNFDRLSEFIDANRNKEVLAFGFTYIIWTRFLKAVKEANFSPIIPDIKILHSGGWKKLTAQTVTKDVFNQEVAAIFKTDPANIIDFYGMVEQLGVLFLDCPSGYKHAPDFADVIMRDPYTMEEVPVGTPGLIQVISALGTSYPSQAILTEDVGEIVGIDDCPCGRKGKYFVFRSRVEKAEIRGCGDTFAERRGD